nr:piggyBac transposable element-derived protein 4-like isoform X2 [Megalopta genalis]
MSGSSDNFYLLTSSDEEGSSGSESDITSKRFTKYRLPIYSDSEEDNNDRQAGAEWTEIDAPPEVHSFRGEPGPRGLEDAGNVKQTVQLFVGDDLVQSFVDETNRYFQHDKNLFTPTTSKTATWTDVTVAEMKKFLALIVIMGQVEKDDRNDYWSADPLIATPIFSQTMTRNRFRQIWQGWNFDGDDIPEENKSISIASVLAYFIRKFQGVYKPGRDLRLSETVIPWRGKLPFGSHNSGKSEKHRILVRTVSEALTGYISNLKVYYEQDQKLNESVLNILQPYLNLWHHVYVDNYYDNIRTIEKLLERGTRVCGIINRNTCIPDCLKHFNLQKYEARFRRKGDVLIQAWKPKHKTVYVISTIHSADLIGTGKSSKRTNEEIKKPACVVEFNKLLKSVNRADQYSCYSILRRSKRWQKKVVLYLINCALFNAFVVHKQSCKSDLHFKKFLLCVARDWITAEEVAVASGDPQPSSSMPNKRAPKYDPPSRLSLDMREHTITKIVGSGKIENPRRPCRVCTAAKKRSSTVFMCSTCGVALHVGKCFEKYHTLEKY